MMRIFLGGRRLSLNARKVGFFGKIRGLMFRPRNCEILLFDSAESIHSLFVFFPFLAIWLDDRNRVLEVEVVKPFTLRISPKKKSSRLVEIPINEANREIVNFLVDGKKI